MNDIAGPDLLVQRLHSLAVQRGLTIKDMAQMCGVPKSSLEGYMRLKNAKRPGVDALIAIADAMGVSIDWLCGRSDGRQVGEEERVRIALSMFRLTLGVLRDIEAAQAQQADPIVKDGKVGARPIEDFALRMMLHFIGKENLFSDLDFDTFRILSQTVDQAHE
ncbi:MAG: helix-turn-helix transcriptional regulator [Pseudomonadota bacterium]